MKKFLAILMTICLLASALSVTAFAASDVLTISAIVKGKTAPVVIGSYTNFEDGWNAAMKLAGDEDEMKKNAYDRVVVDIYTDWNAVNEEFTDDWINGDGFKNDTIYIPEGARVTLNLGGHAINRGLKSMTSNGEIMYIDDEADVIINNGTITGGFGDIGDAGAIDIQYDARVTLNNVNVVDNNSGWDGGGIFVGTGSILTVNGGSFKNNGATGDALAYSSYGGAVHVEGTAIFDGVEFKGNIAPYGAAISADSGNVVIKNCTFDGNGVEKKNEPDSATVIHSNASSITITNSAFTNNAGEELFYFEDSELIMENGSITGNTSGEIFCFEDSEADIKHVTITDNASRTIYVDNGNEMVTMVECTLGNNADAQNSPDVEVDEEDTLIFLDCTLGDTTVEDEDYVKVIYSGVEKEDAAISVTMLCKDGTEETTYHRFFEYGWNLAIEAAETDNYERVIVDLWEDWNTKEYGVITIPSDARMTINMNGHTIDRGLGDSNEYSGEVIYVKSDADLTINGGKDGDTIVKSSENPGNIPMGKISGGNSDNGAGGIHIQDGARVTLNNVNLIGNAVDDDDGAAIAAYDGAILTMNGGSVSNNTLWCSHMGVAWSCGGIYLNNAKAYLKDVEFADNIFRGYDQAFGVAIFSEDSDVIAENCTFKHNGYKNSKNNIWTPISVISVEGGSFDIRNCLFEDNGTKEVPNGPDMINIQGGIVRVSNSIFRNNSSSSAIFCNYGAVEVTDTIFEGTTGNVFRGEADEGSFFKNCTFSGNSTDNSYKTFAFGEDNALDFENCDFGDSTFNDRSLATFDGVAGVGSIFGEGSFTMIVAILALGVSVACMGVTLSLKKKLVPTTANNAEGEE